MPASASSFRDGEVDGDDDAGREDCIALSRRAAISVFLIVSISMALAPSTSLPLSRGSEKNSPTNRPRRAKPPNKSPTKSKTAQQIAHEEKRKLPQFIINSALKYII
jgi:hypothetical protein